MTQALTQNTGLRVIGICDTPSELFFRIALELRAPGIRGKHQFCLAREIGSVRIHENGIIATTRWRKGIRIHAVIRRAVAVRAIVIQREVRQSKFTATRCCRFGDARRHFNIARGRAQCRRDERGLSQFHAIARHTRNQLLRRVEGQAVSTYLETIPRLVSGEARQTAISILAVEAQHLSIIRRNLGLRPVPSALVAGAQ